MGLSQLPGFVETSSKSLLDFIISYTASSEL
jgi:hypothetical protein